MLDPIDASERPVRRRLHGANVPGVERAASAIAGTALAFLGARRKSLLGGVVAGLGAALLARAATGRSRLYRGLALRDAVAVHHAVTIQRSRREVFAFVRALRQTPRWMTHVAAVEETGATSRWIAGVGPLRLTWHAELVDELPDLRLSWRSLPGGDLAHEGSIDLEDAPGGRGTLVTVALRFRPATSFLAAPWRGLARVVTDNQLATDLIRLRQLLETGEVATGVRRIAELDAGERQAVVRS